MDGPGSPVPPTPDDAAFQAWKARRGQPGSVPDEAAFQAWKARRAPVAATVFGDQDLLDATRDFGGGAPAPKLSPTDSRQVSVALGRQSPRVSESVADALGNAADAIQRHAPSSIATPVGAALTGTGKVLTGTENFVRGVPEGIYEGGAQAVDLARRGASALARVPNPVVSGGADIAAGVRDLLPDQQEARAGLTAVDRTLAPEGAAGTAGRLTGLLAEKGGEAVLTGAGVASAGRGALADALTEMAGRGVVGRAAAGSLPLAPLDVAYGTGAPNPDDVAKYGPVGGRIASAAKNFGLNVTGALGLEGLHSGLTRPGDPASAVHSTEAADADVERAYNLTGPGVDQARQQLADALTAHLQERMAPPATGTRVVEGTGPATTGEGAAPAGQETLRPLPITPPAGTSEPSGANAVSPPSGVDLTSYRSPERSQVPTDASRPASISSGVSSRGAPRAIEPPVSEVTPPTDLTGTVAGAAPAVKSPRAAYIDPDRYPLNQTQAGRRVLANSDAIRETIGTVENPAIPWRQPTADPDELLRMAREDRPHFMEDMTQEAKSVIGDRFSGFVDGGLKRRAGIIEKATRPSKAYDSAAQVGDVLRGTVLTKDLASAKQFIDHLQQQGVVLSATDLFTHPTPYGYGGYHLQVQRPGGFVAELQVTTPAMWEARMGAGMHDIYDRYEKQPITSAEDYAQFARDVERSRAVYADARESALHGDAAVAPAPVAGTDEAPPPVAAAAPPSDHGARAAPPVAPVDPALGRARLAGLDGGEDVVTLPDHSKLPVRYRVVEADELRPSHTADTFSQRPDYPEGVQGRRYHADRPAQENVVAGTMKLDPDPLLRDTGSASGTPIITPDGVVVSGNQRTMMMQRAAAVAPERADAYRALLTERAAKFGVDPEALAGMRHPVLVRELDPKGIDVQDPQALRHFNDLSDTHGGKARSTLDEGMARAGRMGTADEALTRFSDTIGPDETLRSYLDGPHGRPFLDALVRDGVVSQQEMGRLVDGKGRLSADGKKLIEDTMYAAAVGDADVLQRAPAGILRKLDSALPAIIRASTRGDYSLQPVLREALDELGEVSARKAEGKGIASVEDLRAQGNMFGADAGTAQADRMARFLEGSSKTEITSAFRRYANGADEATRAAGNANLFGEEPASPETLFQQHFKGQEALFHPGTLYSNPIGPALHAISRNRLTSSAVLATLGALMQDTNNEDVRKTGRFVIGLAALHAIGLARLSQAGGALGDAVVESLRRSEFGTGLIRWAHPDALLTPQVRSAILDYERGVATGRAKAVEVGKAAKALGPEGDRAASDLIEGEQFANHGNLSGKDLEATLAVAQKVADEFDQLGKLKVQTGVLPKVAIEKNAGKYAGPRLYAEYEALDALGERFGGGTGGKRVRVGAQPQRVLGSTPEDIAYRNKLGEIREVSYRAERGLEKGYRDVAAAKLFESLRATPGVVHPEYEKALDDFLTARSLFKEAQAGSDESAVKDATGLLRDAKGHMDDLSRRFRTGRGDYVAMPDTKGMGVLRGMVVTKEVANSLNGLGDLQGTSNLLKFWKRMKTIYNPGTHIGNIASNVTMAHMAGLPFWRQPEALVRAAQDMGAYGPGTKALAEAGILDLNPLTAGSEGAARGGRGAHRDELLKLLATSRPATAKVLTELGVERTTWDRLKSAIGKVDGPLARFYNNEDNLFRVAFYRHATMPTTEGGLGLSGPEAMARSRDDLINFRSRSPALRLVRGSVAPFVLYPAKALPTFARHVIEHPWRYLGLVAGWGAVNEYSKSKVGAITDEDLAPDLRRGPWGYGLPGPIQLPWRGPQGERPAYDISRFTPISGITDVSAPGTGGAAISPRFPRILQPNGPGLDLASIALNVDPYSGDPRFTPAMLPAEKATALAEALGDVALPPVIGFQRRRLVNDIRNADPHATMVDAPGLLGLRPRYVREGGYAQEARYELEQAINQARNDLRRGLSASKSATRDDALYRQFDARRQAAMDHYQATTGTR